MTVPTKSLPALLLFATSVAADSNGFLDKRDNDNEQASQMFQAASRLATVVKASTGMTTAQRVDSKNVQDSVICPLADNVAHMVSKALKEAGDSPEGKTRGMMNKLVGIANGVQNAADKADVSCGGLSKLRDQSDKVKSTVQSHNKKRDNDSDYDTDDDSDDDSDYDSDNDSDHDNDEDSDSDDHDEDSDSDGSDDDSDDDSDVDDEDYTTATALAVSNKKWMGVYKGIENMNSLPNDYLCGSIDTAAQSINRMNEEISSNSDDKVKKLVENGVIKTGKSFTSNAKKNNIKCGSQLSSLNNALNKKANISSVSMSSSAQPASEPNAGTATATASSLSTKAAKTSSPISSPSSAATSGSASSHASASTQEATSGASALTKNAAYLSAGALAALALI